MRLSPLPLCLLALALALGGCDRQPTARISGSAVTIKAIDFRLRPQQVAMPAGRVTITLENRGRAPHNLLVRRKNRVPLRIATVLPGARKTASADLKPGVYELVSTVSKDEQLGQYGTLRLR